MKKNKSLKEVTEPISDQISSSFYKKKDMAAIFIASNKGETVSKLVGFGYDLHTTLVSILVSEPETLELFSSAVLCASEYLEDENAEKIPLFNQTIGEA